MATISLPVAALSSSRIIDFTLKRKQSVITTNAGVTQVTTYPDKRWFAMLEIVPKSSTDLIAWSLALDRLSDLANVVAIGPPHYEGPATSYAGNDPLVNGASQTGQSLVCDDVTISTDILSAGDFLSYDVTSAGGDTNRELNRVTAAAASDGSGNVTFTLLLPIRNSPADDATVEIQSPTALFMLEQPQSAVQLREGKKSRFMIRADERIFP